MTGRIAQTCAHDLSDSYDPNQSTLDSWGETHDTKIAVVSEPTDEILELTDEHIPELGMPSKYLKKFWKRRSDYRMNSAIEEPHNRAYDDLSLDEKYIEYIRESDEAQLALSRIIQRINNGEKITLVCYEKEHERCHRHILQEILEKRVTNEFTIRIKQ